jgi:hypothetical protein
MAINWVKWDVGRFLNGTTGMGANEGWLYTVILHLIYEHGGPIVDDVKNLAYRCRMKPSTVTKALDTLCRKEKIVRADGLISNEKCKVVLEEADTHSGKTRQNSSNLDQMSSKLVKPPSEKPTISKADSPRLDSESDSKEKIRESPPPPIENSDTVLRTWNALASDRHLPHIHMLTEPRRKALRLRLIELGGPDGWLVLLDKIRASKFLCGHDGKWTVTFDWLMKPSNLAKVMEGNYDDRQAKSSLADTFGAVFDRLAEYENRVGQAQDGASSRGEDSETIPGLFQNNT